MPLSVSKLEKLFSTKGFILNKFFVMSKIVMYVEVLSITTAELFLLYIPSKYKFKMQRGDNVFKIKYQDNLCNDQNDYNTAEEYTGEPEEHQVEHTYKEIDINVSPTLKGHNIGPHLDENYKKAIVLKDISNDDLKELRDICRQLKRFKFCVQNVKYKISIIYKNYMCSIKRDNSIECYTIKKYNDRDVKQLYITVDLELVYEKMDSLLLNMQTIRQGLYNILDKNHFTHTKTLQKLMEEKCNMLSFSDKSHIKKQEYEKYLIEVSDMLVAINVSEKKCLEQLHELEEKFSNQNQGLHNDIEKSHQMSRLQTELTKIQSIKEDVVKTIFELRIKRENIMLNTDNVMFDNTVLVEYILRNFSKLNF